MDAVRFFKFAQTVDLAPDHAPFASIAKVSATLITSAAFADASEMLMSLTDTRMLPAKKVMTGVTGETLSGSTTVAVQSSKFIFAADDNLNFFKLVP